MARPRLKIDPAQVEKLAHIGCKDTEIALVLGCSVDTLALRFKENLVKGRTDRKTSLRRKQYEVAMNGSAAMLIFLGKNDLGQTDKQEISGPDGESLAAPSMTVTFVDNTAPLDLPPERVS